MLGSLPLKLDVADDLMEEDPSAARSLLRGLKEQAQGAVTDIRRLVYALRLPTLDDLGLLGAIRETAAQHSANGLNVSVDAPKTLPDLSAAVEVAAYRITQEALTNVVRHARARVCRVKLSVGEMLTLEITDDGVGIRDTGRRSGIANLERRASRRGGSARVELRPEGGTRLTWQARLGSAVSGGGTDDPGIPAG